MSLGYHTLEQTARLFGQTYETICRLTKSGYIKSVSMQKEVSQRVSHQFLTTWTKRLLRIGMLAGSIVTPETKAASNPAVTDAPGDHMVRRSEIINLNAPASTDRHQTQLLAVKIC